MVPDASFRRAAVTALCLLFLGGCSWFSWLPWVDGDKKSSSETLKPAKLTKYEPEVEIRRVWGSKVGDGLGKKKTR